MDRRLKEVVTLSYISTDTFNLNFFTYSITSSAPTFVKTGSLVPVTGATSANCPAGRVLRENGKRLYPGTHSGVKTYMVGVYDCYSFLNGYINPNDPMFAPYNTERPIYQDDSLYTGDSTGQTKNLGPSVLTLGQVAASGDVISASQLRSTDVTVLTINSGIVNINVSLGQVFTLNVTGPFTLKAIGAATNPGAVVFLKLTNGASSGKDMTLDGTTVISPSGTIFNTNSNYMFFSDGVTLNL